MQEATRFFPVHWCALLSVSSVRRCLKLKGDLSLRRDVTECLAFRSTVAVAYGIVMRRGLRIILLGACCDRGCCMPLRVYGACRKRCCAPETTPRVTRAATVV